LIKLARTSHPKMILPGSSGMCNFKYHHPEHLPPATQGGVEFCRLKYILWHTLCFTALSPLTCCPYYQLSPAPKVSLCCCQCWEYIHSVYFSWSSHVVNSSVDSIHFCALKLGGNILDAADAT